MSNQRILSVNGDGVMSYSYGGNPSFEEAKSHYNNGIKKKAQGRNAEALQDFKSARDIFTACSGQHYEAAQYLQWAEQELQNLGG
jgi:hypothetical protein